MTMKLLHLSAYACDKCEGPVILGSFGTRETEISRESNLIPLRAVCLACGDSQPELKSTDLVRDFAPTEWVLRKLLRPHGSS
jgi:hypothetical protein